MVPLKRAGFKAVWWGIFLALLCTAALAADKDTAYFFRAWTAEDGLPENKVVGLTQTADGYLWVATQGGLVRFDGVRFQPFDAASAAGYASSTMRVLYLDRDGRVWIAKEGGALVCLDGTQVRAFTPKDGLPQFEGQRSLAEDEQGNLWISFTKGTVARLNRAGKVDIFGAGSGLPTAGICVLTTDRNHHLWFSKNGRVGVFRGDKFVTLLNLSPHTVDIAPARSDGIWICSGNRLIKFNEGDSPVTLAELPVGPTGNDPTAVLEDREGAVWVGTGNAGLFRCDTNGATSVETSYRVISSLMEDREGNLWVGTRGGGINRIQRHVVSLIDSTGAAPLDGIQSMCQDTTGTLWLVEQNGRIVRRRDGQWEMAPSDVPPLHAISVAADTQGSVWIGGNKGTLYRWKDGQYQSVNFGGDASLGGVRSLLATTNGDLWVAGDTSETNNMLYRLRGTNVSRFNLPAGYRFIRAMAEDASGNFWAGASDGLLVRVTGDTLVDETAPVPRYSIRCLWGTPDGSLWIGYAGFGAGRLRDGHLTRFSSEQGLPNNYVSQILSDDHGGIWFAGNQGIFQVRSQEFDDVAAGHSERVQALLYGRNQGLVNLQASFDFCPSCAKLADGELCFSTLTGLAEAQPGRTHLNRLPPVVLIERVAADEKIFAVYQNGALTNQNVPPLELRTAGDKPQVELPPGRQLIQIDFTALSFVSPENVHFRYRLDGLDNDWVDAGTRRQVQYNRLPPGSYQFKVIACNNDGIWNDAGATVLLTVEPHVWETLWFQVLVAAGVFGGLCGALVLFIKHGHRLQIQRLEQAQALERERTRIARDLHDDLGVGLTEIGLLGDLAGSPAATLEANRGYVHEIAGRARDLVGLLDEIVWAINPANDTSQSLGDYLFRYAQTLLHRAAIRCRLEIVEPFPRYALNSEERHQIFLAFKEALNNVIRHARASEVRVSLSVAGGNLLIRVADNGQGLGAATGPGSHHGLAGMRERLQRLGGRCEINNPETGGTVVTLAIPIRQPKEL